MSDFDPTGAGIPAAWRAGEAGEPEHVVIVRTEYQMRRAAADILRGELAAGRSRLDAVPLIARVLEVSMIRACRLVCDIGPEWVVDQLTRWDLAVTVAELDNWELMTQVPPAAVLRHLASLYEVPREMLGFPGSP